jgi:hypothetical protein
MRFQEGDVTGKEAGYSGSSVDDRIVAVRGQRVMLDMDVAFLYGVPTKRLNEQVRRNREKFPPDFAFRLTTEEKAEVVAKCDHLRKLKFSPVLPMVFTEHGALMAANVLNSRQAVGMAVFVVRAFVRLREALALHRDLARKLDELEQRVGDHDGQIQAVFDAVRSLMREPEKPKRRIGFTARERAARYAVHG